MPSHPLPIPAQPLHDWIRRALMNFAQQAQEEARILPPMNDDGEEDMDDSLLMNSGVSCPRTPKLIKKNSGFFCMLNFGLNGILSSPATSLHPLIVRFRVVLS
jgi:hypothetical protein